MKQDFVFIGDHICLLTGTETKLYQGRTSLVFKWETPATGWICFTDAAFMTLPYLNEWQKKELIKVILEKKPEEIDRNFMNRLFGHNYAPEPMRF